MRITYKGTEKYTIFKYVVVVGIIIKQYNYKYNVWSHIETVIVDVDNLITKLSIHMLYTAIYILYKNLT